MAQTVNHYFNQLEARGEQRLVEDLIIEAIRINGLKVYYVPRTLVKEDPVFGEDPMSKFERAIPIEMYFDNPAAGFQGDRYLISKFGLEMRETASFIVSRRRFNEAVRRDGYGSIPNNTVTAQEVRPLEGDLIYLPVTNDLFQIQFAEHESVFYQLGYRFIWRLNVQKFDYSSEQINTGIPDIDRVQDVFENVDSVANDPIADNEHIKQEATNILDWSEKNPFGEADHQ